MQEGGGAEAHVDAPSQFAAGEAMQFRIQLLEERFPGRSVALFRCLNERRNRLHTASGCPEDVPVSLIHKRLSNAPRTDWTDCHKIAEFRGSRTCDRMVPRPVHEKSESGRS